MNLFVLYSPSHGCNFFHFCQNSFAKKMSLFLTHLLIKEILAKLCAFYIRIVVILYCRHLSGILTIFMLGHWSSYCLSFFFLFVNLLALGKFVLVNYHKGQLILTFNLHSLFCLIFQTSDIYNVSHRCGGRDQKKGDLKIWKWRSSRRIHQW